MLESLENEPVPEYSIEDIGKSAEGNELLEELYDEVQKGAHRYFDSVLRHERVAQIQVNRLEPKEYRELHERLDYDRRLMHNALCDKLRILARAEKKAGRNTVWWKKITGPYEDRNAIRRWALRSVFQELYAQEEQQDE